MMPLPKFLLAFDVETDTAVQGKPPCLQACQSIVPVLQAYDVPSTMFIVANLLKNPEQRAGYQRLFAWDQIAIGSHSLKHRPVRIHPMRLDQYTDCAQWRCEDIITSKSIIEDAFGKPCPGFRSPWSFPDGLAEPDLLNALQQADYDWSSSQLWGEDCTLPAPPVHPYTYASLGFPRILEFPSVGWHENILKDVSFLERNVRARLPWPSPFPPQAIPAGFLQSPEQEVQLNEVFIDMAIDAGLPYVTLVWHPWSLQLFDPEMRMLAGTITAALRRGMEFSTFNREYPALLRAYADPGLISA